MTTRDEDTVKIRTGSLVDRAFWFVDYDERTSVLQGRPKLFMAEVFEDVLPEAAEAAVATARALMQDRGYFGEKHWTGQRWPDILDEMRRRHPGFSDDVYSRALDRGVFFTR